MDDVSKIARGFLTYLESQKKADLLPEIIECLKKQWQAHEEKARVISAVPLSAVEKKAIQSFLRNRFGENFPLEIEIKPEIIAGFIIKVRDFVINQSLLGKLEALRNEK